jgi:hypothetical protein
VENAQIIKSRFALEARASPPRAVAVPPVAEHQIMPHDPAGRRRIGMKVDGSCHCGQIRFEAEINPDRVRICHCTDCQSLSGSAFRVVVPTSESRFQLLAGTPKIYVKRTADSGAPREQAFCGRCGSSIYATSVGGEDRTFGIRVGSLSQRAQLVPRRQFWCESQLPWLPALPGEAVEKQ